MVFANIEYLFLLLLLIPYVVWYIMKRKNSEAALQIPDARVYAHTPRSYKNYLLHVPIVCTADNCLDTDYPCFGTSANHR